MVRAEKNKRKLEDLAAERAVLSGLCQYGIDALLDIDFVDVDYFVNEKNQTIFRCVQKALQDTQKAELSSILSAANQIGCYEQINSQDEIGFLRSLFNFPILQENVPNHAAKLAKLKVARDIKQTLKICSSEIEKVSGDEDINDIISLIETPVLDATAKIYQTSDNKPQIIGDDISDYVEFLKENPSDMIGISTGFPVYDEAIGG